MRLRSMKLLSWFWLHSGAKATVVRCCIGYNGRSGAMADLVLACNEVD